MDDGRADVIDLSAVTSADGMTAGSPELLRPCRDGRPQRGYWREPRAAAWPGSHQGRL